MADLGRLEERLNRDAQLRLLFLSDPVGVLQREGIMLSIAQQQDLRNAVARARATASPVPGAGVSPGKTWNIRMSYSPDGD
jgi:hypothetical protein